MGLVFCDSFDHYPTADSVYKYERGTVPIANGGRRATKCARFTETTFGIAKNIGQQTHLFLGAAIYLEATDYLPEFNRHQVFTFTNQVLSRAFLLGVAFEGLAQCGIAAAADGSLHVIRGAALDLFSNDLGAVKVLSSAPKKIGFNRWSFLEWEITPTLCRVKVNGAQVLEQLAGQFVRDQLPEKFSQFITHGGTYGELNNCGWRGRMDDLYIFNQVGDTNIANTGDVRVDYIRPDGPGVSSESTISGDNPAPTRWESVNDQVMDFDETTVTFPATGVRDVYTHEDLPYLASVVHAVQGVAAIQKDETGVAALRHQQHLDGSDDEGEKQYPAGGEYAYFLTPFDKAADGELWDVEKFNDSQFGIERVEP